MARVQARLDYLVGWALPLRHNGSWESGEWFLRREHCFLFPGDSSMGFRLPIDSTPWLSPTVDYPGEEIDFSVARPALPHEFTFPLRKGPQGPTSALMQNRPLRGRDGELLDAPGTGMEGAQAPKATHGCQPVRQTRVLRVSGWYRQDGVVRGVARRTPAGVLPAAIYPGIVGRVGGCARKDGQRNQLADSAGRVSAAARSAHPRVQGHSRSRRVGGEHPSDHDLAASGSTKPPNSTMRHTKRNWSLKSSRSTARTSVRAVVTMWCLAA